MAPDLQKNVDTIRAARIAKENAMAQVKAKASGVLLAVACRANAQFEHGRLCSPDAG